MSSRPKPAAALPEEPLNAGELKLINVWLSIPLQITPNAPDFEEIAAALSSMRRRVERASGANGD